MLMIGDYDEDLDDFTVENKDRPTESFVSGISKRRNPQTDTTTKPPKHHPIVPTPPTKVMYRNLKVRKEGRPSSDEQRD